MTAGAFLPPDLVVIRQNLSLRKQSFLAAAAQAHSVRVPRSHRLPPVVWLLRFMPALRLLPGQIPPHELRCFSEGNRVYPFRFLPEWRRRWSPAPQARSAPVAIAVPNPPLESSSQCPGPTARFAPPESACDLRHSGSSGGGDHSSDALPRPR